MKLGPLTEQNNLGFLPYLLLQTKFISPFIKSSIFLLDHTLPENLRGHKIPLTSRERSGMDLREWATSLQSRRGKHEQRAVSVNKPNKKI